MSQVASEKVPASIGDSKLTAAWDVPFFEDKGMRVTFCLGPVDEGRHLIDGFGTGQPDDGNGALGKGLV